jgi:hypothetical protein
MDFKSHLENAWNLTLKNITPLVLMTVVMLLASCFTLGILAPVLLAGYTQAVITMVRNGRSPIIQDLFSEMRLFLPLLGFSVVVFIAALIGFLLFFLPGLIILLGVTFGCIFMLPLMTDRRIGLMEAVQTSWKTAIQGNVADHVVMVILYIALMAVGGAVFIGTLFTQPFATVFLVSIYLERFGNAAPTSSNPPPPPEINPLH